VRAACAASTEDLSIFVIFSVLLSMWLQIKIYCVQVDPHLGLAKLGPKIYGEIGKTAVEHGNSLRPKQRRGFFSGFFTRSS